MSGLEELPLPLLTWYRDNKRTLPWRSDPTPYHVLVSEIMLQQTRVVAVLDYYARFMEALPTVKALAACPEDRLLKLWQGLGYYNRARNLQKAARQIMERGGFPSTYGELLTLSGVGEYTAGAIASIAFSQPVPAVDGNVLRVATRIAGDFDDISEPSTKKRIAGALEKIIPINVPGDFNQAIMELGAMVCLPNGAPLCEKCPARDFCVAHRDGVEAELPVKAPKKERRVEARTVWLIFHGKKVALCRRPGKGLLAGLWEYPNALAAAGGEPMPPVAGETAFVATGKHVFSHIEWHMRAYTVEAEGDELPPGWVWADKEVLAERYSVPSAFAPFAHIVEERIR